MSDPKLAAAVEVIEIADLRPCPPLAGPWHARVSARCVCCNDRVEAFIDQRVSFEGETGASPSIPAIPPGQHAKLLALSASAVGRDGVGGWLLIPDRERGVSWVCRSCAVSALDYTTPEVQAAVVKMCDWRKIRVEDRTGSQPKKWGRR